MRDIGILLIRAIPSFMLLVYHGLPKIQNPHYKAVKMIGLPFPELFTWASVLSETLFAVFIIVGLFTRVSAIILTINFIFVVYFKLFVLGETIKENEMEILYLILYTSLIFLGAGKFSIDRK
ncbi:MAG: DoxX family protein [candidate division WOR-3 bacterium]|nr:DoxX family protein [candidate division WOR-3 bacterium]MCX7947782.1 DoxX family protein [candidate division WOR-3 bacterium]MDW8150739.1 DoxX family protein [candidate division WOR-3 bacterium]